MPRRPEPRPPTPGTGIAARGYTLIELMVVLTIIAILSLSAVPVFLNATARTQVEHALDLLERPKAAIEASYYPGHTFPHNNAAAGLPPANKLIGNYVAAVTVDDGALHLELGHKINAALDGRIISVRPLVVDGSPASPIDWACGNASAPEGMRAVGDNRTSVPDTRLPIECRSVF